MDAQKVKRQYYFCWSILYLEAFFCNLCFRYIFLGVNAKIGISFSDIRHFSFNMVCLNSLHPKNIWRQQRKKQRWYLYAVNGFHIWLCSLIVRVRLVLSRTVVGSSDWRFDNQSGSYQHSAQVRSYKSVECHKSGL